MNIDVYAPGELPRRLDDAKARAQLLHTALDQADHVIVIRLTRHVETVDELLADLDARATAIAATDTAGRRQFERDLEALEAEIAFVEDKFRAERAEERGDAHDESRANARAAADQASALRSEIGPRRRGKRDR